jgi:hypothetical protein
MPYHIHFLLLWFCCTIIFHKAYKNAKKMIHSLLVIFRMKKIFFVGEEHQQRREFRWLRSLP